MKKTTKTKKPLYTVDMVGMVGGDVKDVKYRILCAKADAGIVLTPAEKRFTAEYTLQTCADVIFGDAYTAFRVGPTEFMRGRIVAINAVQKNKKPNIFKRFWNWITRKK